MIRIIKAVLKCPKHPKYKAVRPPSGMTLCRDCEGIWYVIQNLKRLSKEYTLKFGMLLLAVLLTAKPAGWEVRFSPSDDNDGVQLETVCYQGTKEVFVAVDYIQVEPDQSILMMRRHDEVPHDAACAVKAFVMGIDTSSPGADAESKYVIDNSAFVDQR